MNNMRQLINLMEGVSAVPGIGKKLREATDDDLLNAIAALFGPEIWENDAMQDLANDLQMHNPTDEELRYIIANRQLPPRLANIDFTNGDDVQFGSLREKSTSEKQARFMAAAAHDPKFAKKTGMDTSVAKEFNKVDTGTKQLSNAMKHKTEEDLDEGSFPVQDEPAVNRKNKGQDFPVTLDQIGRSEHEGKLSSKETLAKNNGTNKEVDEMTQPLDEIFDDSVMDGSPEIDQDRYDELKTKIQNYLASTYSQDSLFNDAEVAEVAEAMGEDYDIVCQAMQDMDLLDNFNDEPGSGGPDNYMDDAEAYASAGHGSDEDYGGFVEFEEGIHDNEDEQICNHCNGSGEGMYDGTRCSLCGGTGVERGERDEIDFDEPDFGDDDREPWDGPLEETDLNNGYKDVHSVKGDDLFPNGADSPITKAVGPSGARQGDNPEQKKLQVAETHKELVYNYRKFLKESAVNSNLETLTQLDNKLKTSLSDIKYQLASYDLKYNK